MRTKYLPDVAAIFLMLVVLGTIYCARLGRQPIVGEESRYATGAREMLATGDWTVPRQQGRAFPERPPMTMWTIAAAGWLRGEVDPIAIRFPSVVAVLLTSLIVYVYTRSYSGAPTALAAGLIYATMGQVLQIGRLGESEALFTLLVSGSLLLWHLGYMQNWPRLATWSIGFAFAALAALVKGPQAPVYFAAITAVYLIARRDWRYLVSWQYAAGAIIFTAVIAVWQIPFYLATDWQTVVATWSGLAADRFRLSGVLGHVFSYPLETFVCLLPWSPLLVALARRETRELLRDQQSVVIFLGIALAVAYPTVWLAAGARGRYFMPLYPLVAVLVALVIERCAQANLGDYPRRAWHQFLLLASVLIGGGGLLVGTASVLPDTWVAWLHQPRWFCVVFALVAGGAVYALWNCYRIRSAFAPTGAVLAIAAFVGFAFAGIMINVNSDRWSDPTAIVAELKRQLPPDVVLVSWSPIEHRFEYYYKAPIDELDWPTKVADLPANVEYFCFMRQPGDTAERRVAGRGRTHTTTPGTLPFAWKELASICIERRVDAPNERTVVVGQVVRPIQAMTSDVTVSQAMTARRLAIDERH